MARFFSKVLDFVGIEAAPEPDERGYDDPYEQGGYESRNRYDERQRGESRQRERGEERAGYRDRYEERGGYRDRYDDREERQPYGGDRGYEDRSRKKGGSKVVNHPSAMDASQHHMRIYQMEDYDDARTVIDDLLGDRSVLINLELVEPEVSQRIVDMLSGATYALGASLKKAAANTYLLAPQSVDVSGSYEEDERRRGGGSFFGGRGNR